MSKSAIGNSLIVTVEPLLVTIVIPPVRIVVPIFSIKGILSTPPLFSQLKGGTKNKL